MTKKLSLDKRTRTADPLHAMHMLYPMTEEIIKYGIVNNFGSYAVTFVHI